MITPDAPDRLYSTRLRTAVVLTGSGTAGAYHAGVLRALHEAGVRIDLAAGRGMGAVTAMFEAIDGGARLWEASGIWKSDASRAFYRWRRALQTAGWSAWLAGIILAFPVLLFGCAILIGLAGLVLTLVGLERAGTTVQAGFTSWLDTLFAPAALPTIVPRLVLLAVLVAVGSLVVGRMTAGGFRRGRRRRGRGAGFVWQLVANPLACTPCRDTFAAELWKLIRGAAPLQQPRNRELGRRYMELLLENVGQPGFRELLVTVHDIDARHDLVLAFLSEQHRARFFGRAAPSAIDVHQGWHTSRSHEAVDLAGVGRDHALDGLCASLALPVATAPHLITFAREGPWRGESHRLCDRPACLGRLMEEVAAAGVEQVVLISSSARVGRPHELTARRADLRGYAGEQLGAFESAGLRDVVEQFSGRFAGLYVIRPEHNPLGPLDFGGVYDERSDREYTLAELVDRGYEDAYRQFIDPIVGASGERIESMSAR